jgi:predicted GTPase
LAKQLNKEEMRREKEELKQLQYVNEANNFDRSCAMASNIRFSVQKQQERDRMRYRMQALTNRVTYNDNLNM